MNIVRRPSLLWGFMACLAWTSAHATLTELTDVVHVEAGAYHACALTSQGAVKCWSGPYYQARTWAADVEGFASGATAVAVSRGWFQSQYGGGSDFSCAIGPSGQVKCWTTDGSMSVIGLPGLTTSFAGVTRTSNSGALYSSI